MAIGLGRIMGFVFPENFNSPYTSSCITEFWRRWHMTLGRWMKDYLYIPLGGNQLSSRRTYFNLWVVFLISGLWHGASWNFVIWGAYHGFFLVAERLFLQKGYNAIGRIPSTAITFFLAILGWVFFRAEDLPSAIKYYESLFSFSSDWATPSLSQEFWVTMGIALFFSFIASFRRLEDKVTELIGSTDRSVLFMALRTVLAIIVFIFSLSMITASDFNPFIYFRF